MFPGQMVLGQYQGQTHGNVLAYGYGRSTTNAKITRSGPQRPAAAPLIGAVFPARDVSMDPRSGVVRRHHADPAVVNKAIKVAARRDTEHRTSNIQLPTSKGRAEPPKAGGDS